MPLNLCARYYFGGEGGGNKGLDVLRGLFLDLLI